MKIKNFIFIVFAMAVAFTSCKKDDEGPTNLTVEAKDYGAFYLNWDNSDDNDVIYRSTGGAEPVFYAEPEARVFRDYELELGETYNYQIVRHDASGNPTDMRSEIVTVVCEGFEPRFHNMLISKDPAEPRNAVITWEVNFLPNLPEGAKIVLSKKGDDDYDYSFLANIESVTAEGSYTDQYALNPGTYVKYKLELQDAEGSLIDDVDEGISVEHNYSLTPTNVSASISDRTAQKIDLSWDAAADAEKYVVKTTINNESPFVVDAGNKTSGVLTIDDPLESGDEIKIEVGGQKEDFREYAEPVELTW